MTTFLVDHIRYNVWATERLLNAGTSLTPEELQRDFGTADKSFQGTLTHILRAERTWLRRLTQGGSGQPWAMDGDDDWAVVVESWPKVHNQWLDFAATLPERDGNEIVQYRDLKDNGWAHPLWRLLAHVVNHSTHHRGQASGFLRAMGKTPPPLDYIAFVRTVAS